MRFAALGAYYGLGTFDDLLGKSDLDRVEAEEALRVLVEWDKERREDLGRRFANAVARHFKK